MKPRVFLSHSKKDKYFIEFLANRLREARIDAWYDNWEIPHGASLGEQIDKGIEECDLFFVYLTKDSIASKWVKVEIDSAQAKVREVGGELAIYVESHDLISTLPLSLKRLRLGVLNEHNIDEAIHPLIASSWEALLTNETRSMARERVRVFKDRFDLINNTNFGEMIRGARSFEIICFSANVLLVHEDHVREILSKGGDIRIVLYDPGPATEVFYSAIAPNIEEKESTKKSEADSMIDRVKHWSEIADKSRNGGKVELKWLSGTVLHYNLWIKDRCLPSMEANLSIYFYGGRDATPAIRADNKAEDLIHSFAKEFDTVWDRCKDEPSF